MKNDNNNLKYINFKYIKSGWILIIQILLVIIFYNQNVLSQDLREYQHGIDFVQIDDNNFWLIWSSTDNPPTGESASDGSWTHDVYYSAIDKTNPIINPTTIISRYEAQEPASSAINSNGNIMITMEDGWNTNKTIAQRYGVYNKNMNDVKPYPNMVFDGGHSGHVSAVHNRFVVFYSDEWVSGGGVNNLGSGDDVLIKVFDSTGVLLSSKDIAVGNLTRDWWPITAGSNNNAALVWQRFVDGETYVDLMLAVYDIYKNKYVVNPTVLESKVKYYTYDVQYLPLIERFLIIGRYKINGGFAYLVDNEGNITARNKELPKLVREAQPAIKNLEQKSYVVYPRAANGIFVLEVTNSSITLAEEIDDNYVWSYIGTDGIFTDSNSVYFASLSERGIIKKTFSNIITNVNTSDEDAKFKNSFRLNQNYPNPFNPNTIISYNLPKTGKVYLDIYDLQGTLITNLISEIQQAGQHIISFKGKDMASGIYYYQLKLGNLLETKKMILMK